MSLSGLVAPRWPLGVAPASHATDTPQQQLQRRTRHVNAAINRQAAVLLTSRIRPARMSTERPISKPRYNPSLEVSVQLSV